MKGVQLLIISLCKSFTGRLPTHQVASLKPAEKSKKENVRLNLEGEVLNLQD